VLSKAAKIKALINYGIISDLRHTAASYLAMSGASLLDIGEVLGHKQMNQTKKYAHLTNHHMKGVVERMTENFGLDERPQASEE